MPTTHRWVGTADAVQQESRATPANVEIGDVFQLIVGGTTIATFTATAGTVANVTAGLTTAWNASTHPWATGITASDQTTYLKLLADTAGVPFTVTSSTTDGGGANTQTLTMTTPTANAGPNVWAAANFSSGSLPANGDTVIIENNGVPILWNLDQSAVTLAELRVMQSYTGLIGLDNRRFVTSVSGVTESFTTSKTDYRDDYLKISADVVNVGQIVGSGIPAGATRLKVNVGSVQTAANVYNTSTASTDFPLQPCRMIGTSGSNVFTIYGGIVGIATTTGSDTSSAAFINVYGGEVTAGVGVAWVASRVTGGTLRLNNVSTTGALSVYGGKVILTSTAATEQKTFILQSGKAEFLGEFDIEAVSVYGGEVVMSQTGNIDTISLDGGTIDARLSAYGIVVDTSMTIGNRGGRILGYANIGAADWIIDAGAELAATFSAG